MKPLIPTIIATSLALLASCGPDKGRDISEFRNASTGDSLMYYYTQMRAYEYWREADSDTSMRNPEQRRRFLDGLKAGMDAIKKSSNDANYNTTEVSASVCAWQPISLNSNGFTVWNWMMM